MTVGEALRSAAQRLDAVSDTARLDAEVLMAHALGVSRSNMLVRRMADEEPVGFQELLTRRMTAEPVAYIVGYQEFYGRRFGVSAAVLIPRADSETTLVAALEAAPAARRVLDCGIGSGALLLSFLAERPDTTGVGIDASPEALEMASQNATALELEDRCDLRLADWTREGWWAELGQFDLVIANPPYVEADADLKPSVREFEPSGALFAGPEGLDDYRILIPQLRDLLAENGVAVLEIGAGQAEAVGEISVKAGFSVDLRRDLAHRPRALILH